MRILRLNRLTLASVGHLGLKLERTKMNPTDRLFKNLDTHTKFKTISFYIPFTF